MSRSLLKQWFLKPVAVVSIATAFASAVTAFAQQKQRIERVEGAAEAKAGSGRWALVVGVDEYQSNDIERLSGAVSDARAIRDALVKYAEFPERQVFLLTSDGASRPTARSILTKLDEIRASTQHDDLVLFFFAGHGVEVAGQRYLLTHDADISSTGALKATALLATTLMQELETIPAAHRVVMIDACRNDPTKGSRKPNVANEAFEAAFTLQPASEGGVRATFLSCSRGQSAYEWTEKGRGFFSYYIEKGLSGEASSRGKVTLTSLIDYLNETVPQAVRQHSNRDQTPYAQFEGPPFVLVRTERLSAKGSLGGPPPPPSTRSLYGVAKSSEGAPLKGATITVGLPRGVGSARGAGAGDAEDAPSQSRVTTDEDGFFRVEAIPAAAEARVTAAMVGYVPKTMSAPPSENGKKISLFLARDVPRRPAESTKLPAAVQVPTEPQSRAQELANVAYRTLLSEDFKEADKSARLALEADPENAVANAVLGNVMMAEVQTNHGRNTFVAREVIEKALRREPTLALAHNALGLTLLSEGDLEAAQAAFLKAIQLDGKLGVAYGNLAHVLWRRNRFEEAERAFKQAATLNPDRAIPYNGLSVVLHSMGRYGDAEKACRNAISRYPLRDQNLASFYVQLAVSLYEQRAQNAWKREQALEAVARAKSLGLTEHPAYHVIDSAPAKTKS